MNSNDARATQGHSNLHVLVVSKTNVELVSLAYSQDPTALTTAVLEDAFRYGESVPVLLLLAEKMNASPDQVSEMMAKRFIHAIPVLQQSEAENDTVKAGQVIEQLKAICRAFPSSVIRTDLRTTCPLCPMNVVFYSTCFPNEMLDFMVQVVGITSPGFSLRHLILMAKIEDAQFQEQVRRELDDHSIEVICTLVNKAQSFLGDFLESRTRFWTAKNFMTVLSAVFQSTSLKGVGLRPPCLETAKPAKELFEPLVGRIGRLSRINTIRIDFGANWHALRGKPDFSLLAPLVKMRKLKNLCIVVDKRWKADKTLMEVVTQILERGKLFVLQLDASTDVQAVQAKSNFLDAAGNCKGLVHLDLKCPGDPADVMRCRKQMLEILQTNTMLLVAWIGELPRDEGTNEFMDSKGSSEQRQIDFLTLLNGCGRKKARKTTTTQTDFLTLLEMETVQKTLSKYRQDFDFGQHYLSNMQYGLLREAPAIWLPCEEIRDLGPSPHPMQERESTASRKRSRN